MAITDLKRMKHRLREMHKRRKTLISWMRRSEIITLEILRANFKARMLVSSLKTTK